MADATDVAYMERALNLAVKGRGHTSPNPLVGTVIVKGRRIIGQGYHHAAGRDHAEVVAIKNARGGCRGATLYVTLEPCCHTGCTGPCTDAIAAAGIKRVVCAVKDPDPRVSGKGLRALRKSGIEVVVGVLRKQARALNEQFFGYHENGRPFIILKWAQSMDGCIATMTGDSKWITSTKSRRLSHQLRSEVDAVVVGSGTVRHDDPALTVRLVKGRNPYRIIVSSDMKLPRKCQLLQNNEDGRTIVAAACDADRQRLSKHGGPIIFWRLRRTKNGLVDVTDLVRQADNFGLRSMLVEGGAKLATSFVEAGLVDKFVIVTAPIIIGNGVSSIGDLATKHLTDAVQFERHTFDTSGRDCVFIGYPKGRG
ncbi:MAG: bifunctional diaminohydroxyphosphoribosylaminopyrimidine deaminase/5-amino-6-(5-phosphoribosylamino)uracil reductase RibD [candidate division Zixibacteria bacterium]|nr:bifunctional diaminohydroxyphosphoribosylaminopyrimidine deaminase/5-amino-6-(5-phosphoribosylamino)uracil reductase RibD [candidate division Zixibacteria bacterium]